MRRLLEVLGFVAVLQGVAGLVPEFTDWHGGLVRRAGFLDGFEIYASVALLGAGRRPVRRRGDPKTRRVNRRTVTAAPVRLPTPHALPRGQQEWSTRSNEA